MLRRILALIQKELLSVLRDPKSRVSLIVPPILQLFVFAFAATLDVQNVQIGILNRDGGEHSIELVQRFYGSPTFTSIQFLKSVSEIAPFIDDQRGMAVISIDPLFSRNLDSSNKADVQLILDGRKSNTAQIIGGYATNIIGQFALDVAKKKQIEQQRTTLVPRNAFNPNLLYYWFNVPNLSGILTMLIGISLTSLSIARERELGTFDQLLVSPLLPIEILIGKTIPAILISLFEGSIIIFVAIFIFKIPFTGSILLLYLSMFVFITSIVGVGLFISSLSQTQQQAILGTFVFISPAVLLSGYATPIENMPAWLQPFTYLNPLRYYLVIAKGLFLKEMPFSIVWMNIWPMILIAIVTLTASTQFFRSRLQ